MLFGVPTNNFYYVFIFKKIVIAPDLKGAKLKKGDID
jgi:hypothetical protein